MQLGATWSGEKLSLPIAGVWNWMSGKVPPSPSHFMSLFGRVTHINTFGYPIPLAELSSESELQETMKAKSNPVGSDGCSLSKAELYSLQSQNPHGQGKALNNILSIRWALGWLTCFLRRHSVTFISLIWELLWTKTLGSAHWQILLHAAFLFCMISNISGKNISSDCFPSRNSLLPDRATLPLFIWVDTGLFKTQSWNISKTFFSFQDKQGRGGCASPSATLLIRGRSVPASCWFVLNLSLLGMKSVAKSDKIF